MDIVDARMRPPIGMYRDTEIYRYEVAMLSRGKRGYGSDSVLESKSLNDLIAQMQRAGISHAIVPGRVANPVLGAGDPASHRELLHAHPRLFTGLAGSDPLRVPDVDFFMKETMSAGLKGVVVEPGICEGHAYLDDQRFFPFYEAMQSSGLVLYAMGGGSAGPDISHSNPLAVDRVAINFPALQIVMIHGGFPYVQEACGVMYRRANVWLLPDIYFPGCPGEQDYLIAARGYAQDRFLFGSAYPWAPLEEHVKRYLELPLTDNVKAKIMGENARRLFQLTCTASASPQASI